MLLYRARERGMKPNQLFNWYMSLEKSGCSLLIRPIGQPTGGPATLKWLTVGGRTSAFVVELQVLGNRKAERTTKGKVRHECLSSMLVHMDDDFRRRRQKRKAS